MSESKVFAFGENWRSFSGSISQERLEEARRSLQTLLGIGDLTGRSFLDIGCGSGLFAIAAAQLGASPVVGMDVDPISVETSRANAGKWLPDRKLRFEICSVLDEKNTSDLGQFDIVYSWGVLHHTGNMRQAIRIAVQRVRPQGRFVIAIYNRHITSPVWKSIKWFYNILPRWGRRVLVWIFAPIIYLAKLVVTGRNPIRMSRGMDFMHNVVDWIGGYPYEYASVAEMETLLQQFGLEVLTVFPARVPTGCNEFVCALRA